jgi:uncharacterized protein YbbK (DUF523 family)
MGSPVRHDGGHKRDAFVVDVLAIHARLVPVCPEVEFGLGTPRPTLHLVRAPDGIRLMMAGGRDLTAPMRAFIERRLDVLSAERLDGYVLKSRSPSCGWGDAVILGERGSPAARTDGVLAAALADRWPGLPMATEATLSTPDQQNAFLERVIAYHRAIGHSVRKTGP